MNLLPFMLAKRNVYRLDEIANLLPLNRVWFDDIVAATEYLGPIHCKP